MTIEFQHVTGAWKITDYDSRDDPDALPEQKTLKGTCTFRARFDVNDRAEAIHVADPAGNYLLSVREMVFPIVRGRLIDREARDGVMLPAVAGGVPIIWTATPELQEDPGTGIKGAPVPANSITFGPAEPDGRGSRAVNLADIADTVIEYPEPVVSRVAQLVREAEAARDASAGHVQYLDDVMAPRIEDLLAQTTTARNQAEQYAQQAFDVIPPATDTQLGKLKLRGDLGGTAENPTVPAVQSATPNATAGTLAKRDGGGALSVATPTAAGHAATKGYTDGQLAKKANLDESGKVPQAELPAIAVTDFLGNVASQTAMLALAGQRGDWCNRTDLGTEWQLIAEPSTALSSWMQKIYPASDVTSVHGRKGAVTTSSADITDATATGRELMKATDAIAARAAIDAAAQQDLVVLATDLNDLLDWAFLMLNLRDAGLWSMSGTYEVGQVVTYNHGRYYCREDHGPVATFPAANYVWLGLAAVAAASDPGGGRLWVKI